MKQVVIIGGGIIGQFIAYHLPKDRFSVTIFDDNPEVPSPSVGNCGLITPSHIVPLNQVGLIWQGLKWLGKKDAPFSIRPQTSLDFYRWIVSFVWNARKVSQQKALTVRHQLLKESWVLYEKFMEQHETNLNWKKDGLIYVANSNKGLKSIEEESGVLDEYGLENELLSRDELLDLEPQLNASAIGGGIFKVDGWLNPVKLMDELRKINAGSGVCYQQGKVGSFSCQDRIINELTCSDKRFDADEFIICNGALAARLSKNLGINLPIIPGKGYNLTTTRALHDQPSRPIYMTERKVVATPWEDGFRLGSTMEFAGFDNHLNEHRLKALRKASQEYLKTKIDNVDFTPWTGWRPMSSKGHPIIERSSKYTNLTIAVGHGMLGLSMAPATGMMVSQLLQDS